MKNKRHCQIQACKQFVKLGAVCLRTEAHIFNGLGQEIEAKTFTNTDTLVIDVGGANGVYFLRLKSDGKIATLKVIKK